ncbi:MAG: D-alanyl-D-alanine carboxypeptidase [Clostridia bacterium]|nr:D-alanyl-D-alanine carboxypeptidase [Clostridia bacterium]
MLKRGLAVACILLLLLPCSVMAESIPLSSLSAVVYEPDSGRVLYAKDPDTKRPMASTTKLMTALVAADCLPMEATVTIPETAVLVEGSSMGLRGGDTLTVRDLLTGMLLSSGNDAANAVALLSAGSLPSFAERMNVKAKALGMMRSVFVTPSGLDEGEHGSTARDMALLGAAILKSPDLAAMCAQKRATVTVSGNPVTLSNHNRLLSLYEPAVGLKTGFTKQSGRCLVSAARRDGVTLVVATLNGGDYWNDHIALYEYGFSQTESVSLVLPDLPLLSVCGGTSPSVALRADVPEAVTLLKGEAEAVTCRVELPHFTWAPLEAGESLGTIVYELNGSVLRKMPITAEHAVAERAPLGFFKKWKRQLHALLIAILE